MIAFIATPSMVRWFDKLTSLSKVEGQAHHPEPVEGSTL
jgi:hypothetical protein